MAKLKLKGEGGLLSKIGRRNGIILCAVLLIGAAVVLNYVFFYGDDGKVDYGSGNMEDADGALNETPDTTDTYFASASLSREQARDEALAVLQTILAEETATEETKPVRAPRKRRTAASGTEDKPARKPRKKSAPKADDAPEVSAEASAQDAPTEVAADVAADVAAEPTEAPAEAKPKTRTRKPRAKKAAVAEEAQASDATEATEVIGSEKLPTAE